MGFVKAKAFLKVGFDPVLVGVQEPANGAFMQSTSSVMVHSKSVLSVDFDSVGADSVGATCYSLINSQNPHLPDEWISSLRPRLRVA